MSTPEERIRQLTPANSAPEGRKFVLYWCIAQRRMSYNFALDYAIEEAKKRKLPLVILEPLGLEYHWNSLRQHQFIIQGMRDNAAACEKTKGIYYYPYVEKKRGEGKGLLAALSRDAALVVSDDAPYFFFPKIQAAAAKTVKAPIHLVDSNGLLPISCLCDKWSSLAHSFRRRAREFLPEHLERFPKKMPFRAFTAPDSDGSPIQSSIFKRWPKAELDNLVKSGLATLSFDNEVPPAAIEGGSKAASNHLRSFCNEGLGRYLDDRLNLDNPASSGFSPWLHFGHISAHQIFEQVTKTENWDSSQIADTPTIKREGWWGASPPLDAFLDQLATWRELGFHTCALREDYASLSSIPDWARASLGLHRGDERTYIYDLETLAAAETHDPIWNAAQRQLLEEGVIHNAIRMVWGKLVMAWTRHPEVALEYLIELNNRYALDGRDPNSYSGILWCFGRHDRAWGPERPVFGKVRYMTSANFRKKSKSEAYLKRWGG